MGQRKRHTPDEIIRKLRDAEVHMAEGKTIAEVAKLIGVSEQTFARWRNQYGGMKGSDAKRLKELEDENRRLKKLVAEQALDNAMLKDIAPGKLLSPTRRRRAVEHLREEHGVSERRACKVHGQPRSTQRRREESPGRYLPLVRQLKELAARFPRWGTPKMTDFINKSGPPVNHKRIERLWRKEGMQVPMKARKRRRLGSSENGITRRAATEVNEVWSYDFVFDRTEDGRRLKILTVVDEYSRECLAIEVGRRFKANDVIDVLTGLMIERGTPRFLRSDNGPEFIARRLRRWLGQHGVRTLFIEPGSPWQNAFVESFNGKLRDELLDCELFYNLEEARVLAAEYRTIYNEIRPHAGLQGRTPSEVAAAQRGHAPAGAGWTATATSGTLNLS
ncbi:MAG: IS3 family transposase [Planctomycetota bacterium]